MLALSREALCTHLACPMASDAAACGRASQRTVAYGKFWRSDSAEPGGYRTAVAGYRAAVVAGRYGFAASADGPGPHVGFDATRSRKRERARLCWPLHQPS